MIIDDQLTLSLEQSVVGTAATAYPSTNTVDLRSSGSDLGSGEPVKLFASVGATAFVGGSGGVKIDYIQSANANLSAPDVLASITTAATPAAGTVLVNMVVPQNTKRYVGIQFTPLTSNTTAGTINAYLVKDTPTIPT